MITCRISWWYVRKKSLTNPWENSRISGEKPGQIPGEISDRVLGVTIGGIPDEVSRKILKLITEKPVVKCIETIMEETLEVFIKIYLEGNL